MTEEIETDGNTKVGKTRDRIMKSCEQYEIDLSSLIDGELSPVEASEVLEHALGCPGCADFFRAARRVEGAAERLRAADGALDPARADELWHAVESRSAASRTDAPAAAAVSPRGRTLRAAALVALGLGGGYLLSGLAGPGSPASTLDAVAGGLRPASLGAPAAMDERRFVAVADELMRSDVRFQRAMLEVLRLVPALESGEGLRSEDAPRIVRASNEDDRGESGEI